MLDAEGTSKKGKERARQGLAEGYKPPGTWQAVQDITKERGMRGLWTGFRLHAGEPLASILVLGFLVLKVSAAPSSRHTRHSRLLCRIRCLTIHARSRSRHGQTRTGTVVGEGVVAGVVGSVCGGKCGGCDELVRLKRMRLLRIGLLQS